MCPDDTHLAAPEGHLLVFSAIWRASPMRSAIVRHRASVAQLDRASGFEPEGRRFESCRAHPDSLRYAPADTGAVAWVRFLFDDRSPSACLIGQVSRTRTEERCGRRRLSSPRFLDRERACHIDRLATMSGAIELRRRADPELRASAKFSSVARALLPKQSRAPSQTQVPERRDAAGIGEVL